MNKRTTLPLALLCVALLLSFCLGVICSSEHECNLEYCPACLLADSVKSSLALLFLACVFDVADVCLSRRTMGVEASRGNEALGTPISLKVKLSN